MILKHFYTLIACLILFYINLVLSANNMNSSKAAIKYLEKFGYADHPIDVETRSGAIDFKDFLKKFQDFFSLRITGSLDKETLEVMSKPRCGVPDFSVHKHRIRRYKLQGSTWPNTSLKWRVSKFSKRSNMRNKESATLEALQAALQTWSENSALEFISKQTSSNESKVDIDIRFEVKNHNDNNEFDGEGGTLAHAFFPQYGGSAHFDDDENWSFNSEGTHLQSVALHEFGHSLGLSHSNVKGSVMYPTYAGVNTKLTEDDIKGIQEMYGTPKKPSRTSKPSHTAKPSQPTTTLTPPKTTKKPENVNHPLCNNHHIDTAFCLAARDCYFVSGNDVWKVNINGERPTLKPVKLWEFFPQIRGPVKSIFKFENNFFILQGDVVYRFAALGRTVTSILRLPQVFPGLPLITADTIYQKEKTGNVYIYYNDMYWRFNSQNGLHTSGYPKTIRSWDDLPDKLDAAMPWDSDTTFFFKNNAYWLFNERRNIMLPDYPKKVDRDWLGCSKR